MGDEPMWAADRIVAPTLGSAITIPETANEFAIKGVPEYVPPKLGDPRSFLIPCTFSKDLSCNTLADLGASINLMSIDVIDEILEEDFDALLDEENSESEPESAKEEPFLDLELKPLPEHLEYEKCHFMVKEGIVLGHKVSGACLEVEKAKIDIISKLPPPTNVKGIGSFLGHACFY
ncbi:hypothetical protein Tco_1192168 [Tanacetum coccineum]